MRLLSDEGLALLDVLLELREAGVKEFLLLSGEGANRVDLLNTVRLQEKRVSHKFLNSKCTQRTPSSTLDEKYSMPCSSKRGLLTYLRV